MMNTIDLLPKATSIEELTVQSLEQSAEGIEALKRDSLSCGDALLANDPSSVEQFTQFIKNLGSFYVFENDICSLFQIDPAIISNSRGHMKTAETRLTATINEMLAKFAADDRMAVADLLRIDVPAILNRFGELLPQLREYVEREYLAPAV